MQGDSLPPASLLTYLTLTTNLGQLQALLFVRGMAHTTPVCASLYVDHRDFLWP